MKYRVDINWYGGEHKFFRHAISPEQALRFAIRQLAKEVGYTTQDHFFEEGKV